MHRRFHASVLMMASIDRQLSATAPIADVS
jgi:hypothetical protein